MMMMMIADYHLYIMSASIKKIEKIKNDIKLFLFKLFLVLFLFSRSVSIRINRAAGRRGAQSMLDAEARQSWNHLISVNTLHLIWNQPSTLHL